MLYYKSVLIPIKNKKVILGKPEEISEFWLKSISHTNKQKVKSYPISANV